MCSFFSARWQVMAISFQSSSRLSILAINMQFSPLHLWTSLILNFGLVCGTACADWIGVKMRVWGFCTGTWRRSWCFPFPFGFLPLLGVEHDSAGLLVQGRQRTYRQTASSSWPRSAELRSAHSELTPAPKHVSSLSCLLSSQTKSTVQSFPESRDIPDMDE